MSNTPETNSRAWSDHSEGILHEVVEANFARKLERERDEARDKYNALATEHMLAVNKLCEERDEAREQVNRYRYNLDLLPI